MISRRIIYTMWSDDGRTIITNGDDYTYKGDITTEEDAANANYLCDVVFAVPAIRSTCADPENTLKRAAVKGDPFDGQTGVNSKGEVYFLKKMPNFVKYLKK